MTSEPAQLSIRIARSNGFAYLIVCVAFVLASLASGVVLRVGDGLAGTRAPATPPRAWFLRPLDADRGLRPGQSVTIVATGSEERPLVVHATCGSKPILAVVRTETATYAHVPVPASCSDHWLVVQVGSIRLPLRAWVT